MSNEYYCGCQGKSVTDCRCMRGYTLPRRFSEAAKDVLWFLAGGVVCLALAIVAVGIIG